MNNELENALEYYGINNFKDASSLNSLKVVRNPVVSYADRHRGNWFRPDYNFGDIQRAQDTDSLIGRAIELKASKFLLAGWEFVGENPQTVEYIKKRIQQTETITNIPFPTLMYQTVQDLARYNNAMWAVTRDSDNSGGRIYTVGGVQYKPISGLFMLPFETLEYDVKPNGHINKVRQVVPGSPAKKPEWKASDTIHFHMNKRPGFIIGSPILFAVLEDISLLRRIEENVEELIESSLFPLFHYKIGNDKYPVKVNNRTGLKETDVVAETLEYMPSSGCYISDWRHEITAIGSEGRALRIDYYLDYFKKRVYAGLGVSPVDFGESSDANRSTAQTQSKALTESIEALQKIVKTFIDFYLIKPLLIESTFSFDPLAPENLVEIKFNKIDTVEQSLLENGAIQLWLNNAITHEELRHRVGLRPLRSDQEERLTARLFPNPVPQTATLPGAPGSTMSQNQVGIKPKTPSKVKDIRSNFGILKDNLMNDYWDLANYLITFTNGLSPGELTDRTIDDWAQKSTDRLYAVMKDRFDNGINSTGEDRWNYNVLNQTPIIRDYSLLMINSLIKALKDKIHLMVPDGISVKTIFSSLEWRIKFIQSDSLTKAYNYGRAFGFLLNNDSIKVISEETSCETCKKHNGMIINREDFNFDMIPPSLKNGHPNCKCKVELNS